ncbi:PepSY-associated TM helix domain-containing protein [Massilia sp. S19_KUP03_FR1]|uniref:PepSY-associated TM helix domain-containing protein n=1 Tax=Massilia sp. S19_KUP03_FR1 TaxID=3025503 RepID=UPI002FCDA4D3
MTPNTLRRWSWIHKWSSLICTVFMLLLCITGLPLIYHHEIVHALGNDVAAPVMPDDTPRADIDKVIASGMAAYPGKMMMYLSQDKDEPGMWALTLGDSPTDENYKPLLVDARTAQLLPEPPVEGGPFMSLMFHLHVDLYAGLWGKLFLGLMGLLLIVALVSGVVLYAPFMRKLQFGTVRHERSRRVRWLDLHNVLGIVTLVWALVVGSTGMINTWADLLLKVWQNTELAEMTKPYAGLPPVTKLASMQQAITTAQNTAPGMEVGFVAFPGTPFATPHHYGVFMHGDSPLTSRLPKPILIDAQTGVVSASGDLPWYLAALLVSQPLHFGDYGGQALKLLWALLDLATIVVLITGLYLWLKRGRAAAAKPAEQRAREAA